MAGLRERRLGEPERAVCGSLGATSLGTAHKGIVDIEGPLEVIGAMGAGMAATVSNTGAEAVKGFDSIIIRGID
jgi:hypothetical protein